MRARCRYSVGSGSDGGRVVAATDTQDRFAFGENWQRFLRVVDEERVATAGAALQSMLGSEEISGRSFLDVGCGSGLSSLAAVRCGASRVHSFDYDPASV